jgi:hypothetical protein
MGLGFRDGDPPSRLGTRQSSIDLVLVPKLDRVYYPKYQKASKLPTHGGPELSFKASD